jgi:hypothetical protein
VPWLHHIGEILYSVKNRPATPPILRRIVMKRSFKNGEILYSVENRPATPPIVKMIVN